MKVNEDLKVRNKSRRSFVMLIAAFALPIIIAKLALEFHWLDYGVTNKGELLANELTVADFTIDTSTHNKQWLMVYVLPKQCDALCQQILVGVNNTYIALGKEMPRVTPYALYQSQISSEQQALIRIKDWQLTPASENALNNADLNQLYIVDPLGNIFMSHQLPAHQSDIASFGKSVLADMKKLLKYSKVG